MIPKVDDPTEYPAGWSIDHGTLALYGFDNEGRSYAVLTIDLWNPNTGEWLVDKDLLE